MEKTQSNPQIIECYSYENDVLDLLQDYASEDEFENIDDRIDREIMVKKIYQQIDSYLTIRERQVLSMTYGLFGESAHTIADIAQILRVTESNIYKVLKNGITKLRNVIDDSK